MLCEENWLNSVDFKKVFLCLLQTERTSTQSAGTSTGPTFSTGATGIPPEGSEPLFQMFDMGPNSVTEISAHVIPTERDMPPGSVHGKFSLLQKQNNCACSSWQHRNGFL